MNQFELNDRVYDIRYGWGKVIHKGERLISVLFNEGEKCDYSHYGSDYINDKQGLLKHHEYKIKYVGKLD